MVDMFMGHENGVNLLPLNVKLLKPLFHPLFTDSSVYQEMAFAVSDIDAVSAAPTGCIISSM